jgi:regulator of sigma E protease
MILAIIVIIITLLVLVVSHEFGHFITAKKFDVEVQEFGFGIPPRAWGKKIGETIVSVNWLPIGGFVRLLGEDETDKKKLKDKRSFANKPVIQRIGIVVAGVVANFLLAVVLFYAVLASQGFKEKLPLLVPHQFAGVQQSNESIILIGGVAPDSPASAAGIKSGDRVVEFNSQKLDSGDQFIKLTKQFAGKKVTLTLEDQQRQKRVVELTPRENPPKNQGALGVELASVNIANLNYATLDQKLTSGFVHSYNLTTYSFDILGSLIASSLRTHNFEPVSESVSGPVGITNMTRTILQTQNPLIPYLNFIALLSLNLAIINILPFPALDGGRLFFLLIEFITRRKVNPAVERWVHTIGMVLLIALIVVITLSDISKIIH